MNDTPNIKDRGPRLLDSAGHACTSSRASLKTVSQMLNSMYSRVSGQAALNRGTIAFRGITKRFGSVVAVDGIDLEVGAGEFLSLLGPSGSGKSTLLMIVAGFETPTSGSIAVGERDLTYVAPNKRGIGMVFQRYALFPHMTVAQNVAFPLRMRGVLKTEIGPRVERALALVHLQHYGARMPGQLSGGQQQRVAVARALVFEPRVLLMDEPLGALDKKLREELQIEIKKLHERLGVTIIYVTHDQEEALTMSDRIAVMDKGKIQQVGSPTALYHAPNSSFVADFIGKMNFLNGYVQAIDEARVNILVAGGIVGIPRSQLAPGTALVTGQPIRIAARPESIAVTETSAGSISGEIETSVFLGSHRKLIVRTDDGTQLQIQVPSSSRASNEPRRGRTHLTIDATAVRLFPHEV